MHHSTMTVDSEAPTMIFKRATGAISVGFCSDLPRIKMATKIENLIQQSLRTFRRRSKILPESIQNELPLLKALVDDITLKDIKLPKFLLQNTEVHDFYGKKSKSKIDPVEYLRIYEDGEVTIGVFVLRQGAKLPIHDHPSMYGLLKVLQGIIKVTTYSVVEIDTTTSLKCSSFFYQHPLKVIKHPQNNVGDKDSCCVLTPTERNIHEVECIHGPAAFLDVLAPPYEGHSFSTPRGCHYFKEVEDHKNNDGYVRLMQISNPIYWAAPNEESADASKNQ